MLPEAEVAVDERAWPKMEESNMKKFYVCRCFYTNNYFIPRLNIHVVFQGEKEFRREYGQKLFLEKSVNEAGLNDIIIQLETERQRRMHLAKESISRRETIERFYKPLKPYVYKLKESILDPRFIDLVIYCKRPDASREEVLKLLHQEKASRVYSFPVFTSAFCDDFLAEVLHFEKSDSPKCRPNTMNQYGVLLDELGFDEELLTPLRENYLIPIAKLLFPDWGGDSLDSHKAFIVSYDIDRDRDLNYHYDNAEVTLNVALSTDFTDGTLYFGDMRGTRQEQTHYTEYNHRKCFGVLHRGQHRHGALPIESGERHNLIIWMRSSKVRNQLCPMCDQKPDLVETSSQGDGFTSEEVVMT